MRILIVLTLQTLLSVIDFPNNVNFRELKKQKKMDQVILCSLLGLVSTVLMLLAVVAKSFMRCPPNTALVIQGKQGSEPRVITDGGTLVFPLFETVRTISLESMQVSFNNRSPISSSNGVPLIVNLIAQVRVQNDLRSIAKAAQTLSNKDTAEIVETIQNVISSKVKDEINQTTVDDLIANATEFCNDVMKNSNPELSRFGLRLTGLELVDIFDSAGYLAKAGKVKITAAQEQYLTGLSWSHKT